MKELSLNFLFNKDDEIEGYWQKIVKRYELEWDFQLNYKKTRSFLEKMPVIEK